MSPSILWRADMAYNCYRQKFLATVATFCFCVPGLLKLEGKIYTDNLQTGKKSFYARLPLWEEYARTPWRIAWLNSGSVHLPGERKSFYKLDYSDTSCIHVHMRDSYYTINVVWNKRCTNVEANCLFLVGSLFGCVHLWSIPLPVATMW
jgi:hypothetical protein